MHEREKSWIKAFEKILIPRQLAYDEWHRKNGFKIYAFDVLNIFSKEEKLKGLRLNFSWIHSFICILLKNIRKQGFNLNKTRLKFNQPRFKLNPNL
jgi:hypothetical protein